MKKYLLLACSLGLVALAGCDDATHAKASQASDNSAYNVSVLFTDSDGFTVKRFWDRPTDGGGGQYVYYATGPGDARTEFRVQQGKTSVKKSVSTATSRPSHQ